MYRISTCGLRTWTVALIVVAAGVSPLAAQEDKKKIPVAEIKVARIGFIPNDPGDNHGRYKVGMWTPVYVKIKAGPKGIGPKGPNEPEPYIQIENEDNEDVGTIYRTPFRMGPNEERWVMSYAKPGKMSDVKMRVVIGDLEFKPLLTGFNSLELNTHLYVSLGERLPDLQSAIAGISPRRQQNQLGGQQGIVDTWPRYAGYEPDAEQLPDHWFGYHGVDLLFLSTRDNKFLLELGKDNDASRDRLRAIAQYVRRGGRLIVSVSTRNSDVLNQVLSSTVWQPPLPAVPPKEGSLDIKQRLFNIEAYAGVGVQAPFSGPHKIAALEPARLITGAWEVLATAPDEAKAGAARPVMVRMPYGLGSITLLAFPLDEQPFTTWPGRTKFLEQLVQKLGPRAPLNQAEHHQRQSSDLSTELQRQLDNFDVRVIPFGYVALFIILYILIVGPLDFVLLKYVFKRLEWTWFTFPTVVLAVSVAAYFTAYAIKGSELKINKVDLVDFDLRTHVDAAGQTKKAAAYGHTFFTILSPQIRNYTIGVEPNPLFWGHNADKPASADMVTWLGRAEANMFGGMGARGSGQGFFRKPYSYEPDAVGLRDVPIPVWTTKSFHAAWEMTGLPPPLQVDLSYHQQQEQGKDMRISGTIKSGLAVDLEDVWLLYLDKAYPIDGGLAKGVERPISFEAREGQGIRDDWAQSQRDGPRLQTAQGVYNPSPLLRQIQFNERVDHANTSRNHAFRALDLSWRIKDDPLGLVRDRSIREAILVGRVKFVTGQAENLTADVNQPLPTNLWLHDLPGPNRVRPRLDGLMAQDTFVRIILPVKPKE
ncbi:MAG: hypothetical protein L0Y71_17135 [Gemmataceae bacterium]|nr:hypothetical protein [Gemmataceae bacterium]